MTTTPAGDPPWFALVTFRTAQEQSDRLGALRADGTVVVDDAFTRFAGLRPALASWPEFSGYLRSSFDPAAGTPVPDARVLAPVRYPNKLLCAGANYRDHAQEMSGRPAPTGTRPWFFCVPPTTTVIGPGDPVAIPPDPGARVDWEVELAVVIGARLTAGTREQALRSIAGYTILNDVSARGLGRVATPVAPAMEYDWLKHKGLDGFKPTGPGVVPAWLLDAGDLRLRLWVNDELKQDGSTRDLIFGIPELLVELSATCTLEPGDIVATGTPAGVGAARNEFLRPGDTVRLTVEGIGSLSNPIVAAGT